MSDFERDILIVLGRIASSLECLCSAATEGAKPAKRTSSGKMKAAAPIDPPPSTDGEQGAAQ